MPIKYSSAALNNIDTSKVLSLLQLIFKKKYKKKCFCAIQLFRKYWDSLKKIIYTIFQYFDSFPSTTSMKCEVVANNNLDAAKLWAMFTIHRRVVLAGVGGVSELSTGEILSSDPLSRVLDTIQLRSPDTLLSENIQIYDYTLT